jgi:hypothetical protein
MISFKRSPACLGHASCRDFAGRPARLVPARNFACHQLVARDLQLIFEAILKNAMRICVAEFGNLWLREGDKAARILRDNFTFSHMRSNRLACRRSRRPVRPLYYIATGAIIDFLDYLSPLEGARNLNRATICGSPIVPAFLVPD